MAALTRKERFERALRCEEVDRLPFWVKIFGPGYLGRQELRYQKMSELELADYLDLDHMAGGGSCVVGTNERVKHHIEQQNRRRIQMWKTPSRMLTGVDRFDEGSHSWHPVEFPIKDLADLRSAKDIFAHTHYHAQENLIATNRERLRAVGDRGIVMTGMGISPLMNLVQHLMGPANTYYFMADYPDDFDELVALMHEDRLRFLRALVTSTPFDYICCVENTSTALLSPKVFERYCRRHLQEYGEIIANAGKYQVLHQCGKLKALLPSIDTLPAVAIEAYTTPPVGDTTLADRVALSPNTAVIGGTDVTLWLKPVEQIVAQIKTSLREAGTMAGVVLTSAGVMTPLCPIERIIEVRKRLYDFTPAMFTN
ncbi:MAG: uroporphyrinogen decarboxylase family protein [Candidatus Zipacnadales bacterium]